MSTSKLPIKILDRPHEITHEFLHEIDLHLADIVEGRTLKMLEIRDLADRMHIDARHLSNTIKHTTGKAPCFFFEEKILNIAKAQLQDASRAIADIATGLTYDPSNFTKFFKRFTGLTPKQYRESLHIKQTA